MDIATISDHEFERMMEGVDINGDSCIIYQNCELLKKEVAKIIEQHFDNQ